MRTFDPMNLPIYLWSMVFMENHSFHTPWCIQTAYEIHTHPMIHMVFKYDKGKTSIFLFIKWFVGSKIVLPYDRKFYPYALQHHPLWFAKVHFMTKMHFTQEPLYHYVITIRKKEKNNIKLLRLSFINLFIFNIIYFLSKETAIIYISNFNIVLLYLYCFLW